MIIVLAVLAIMFVGICVALHLFSKARFRNRRTIFNSPHPRLMHIKLGKRKKSSVRTQHLPPPPGQFIPRHHSFSGHHSPYPIHRVAKTRSHECLRSALSRESSPKFEHRPKTAPLAERESLPSSEDLDKKTPEPLQNGLPSRLSEEECQPQAPGSPTVIITDADGAHTVVTSAAQSPGSAVNV
ncbi:EB domain-containing protein [Trichonephila clavata]|nr:EB domain-containing protein [Trichonephila clavata]